MKEQALSDLTVVEWGSFISAAFCTKFMADLGAEVIKVEPPGSGDLSRQYGPFPDDIPHNEKSGLFLYLNTNKFGVTIDPGKDTGRELLLKLLQNADIFVENQPPRLTRKLKLDFKSVKRINPKLIMTSITPYGQTGPYRDWIGYDINCSALGGITNAMGSPDREPLTPPLLQGYYQGGLMGAIATMIALFERASAGKGLHVDVSIAESWATFHIGVAAQSFIADGRVRRRSGHRALHRPYPDGVLPCKDGYVCVDTPQNRQWRRLIEAMGNPQWANDPIFDDRIRTTDEYADKADAYLIEWLMKHTKEELFKIAQDNRIPVAPIRTVEEVVNDVQLNTRSFFVEVDHPDTGKLKYPSAGYQLSETPSVIERPAPRLGEHNEEIFCRRLGYSREELVALRRAEVI